MPSPEHRSRELIGRALRTPFLRESLIFAVFCLLTALMTWPWVLHLRDAVADRGDPYAIAWTLWWDYHQTFSHPFQLFDANVFYPYKYTLAFTENDYGIALLFFPLFAAGVRLLTIHSIATFLGFAFSGYGAFRLTRTLTDSNASAWIAGIVFAFIPFRFHVLSHLHYVFAGWVPLLLEALVLFARYSSWRRAIWLGIAFLMNGLSCISWFIMTLIPLALTVVLLLMLSSSLRKDRNFWVRGSVALGAAAIALTPFLAPYYIVSVKYGLRWQPWEFAYNSPSLIHWLKAERRNHLWQNFGARIPGGHPLFPGLLAPLLAVAAFRSLRQGRSESKPLVRSLILGLYFLIALAAIVAGLALYYQDVTYRLFGHRIIRLNLRSVNHALAIIIAAFALRLALSLPALSARVRERLRTFKNSSLQNTPTVGIALIWTICGFVSSLGANFFLNRWLHHVLIFQSIRLPSRWAMICYVGLAVLAGIGAKRVAESVELRLRKPRAQLVVIFLIVIALLFELRAFPLAFDRGETEPSAVALRLKSTPMKGGIVELPSEEGLNRHFYMLRAADHGRPLVNATASFISPLTDEINVATREKISPTLMDLLEGIPASYLVIHNDRLRPERRADNENFVAGAVSSERLRFINRFDGHDDLYAVTKTENEAQSEAPLPFDLSSRDWGSRLHSDPINLLGAYVERSQTLYRIYLASTGSMPRYSNFITDLEAIGRRVIVDSANEEQQYETNLERFAEAWIRRDSMEHLGGAGDAEYVDRLVRNAGLNFNSREREDLVRGLSSGQQTRAGALLKIVSDKRFITKENYRSLVLLHYFGYLRRNPDDPPDRDFSGFDFWLKYVEWNHDPAKLAQAFKESIEFQSMNRPR